MGKSLWSIEGVPIKVTWVKVKMNVPIKWMESMRNEWIEWIEPFEVKWVNWRKWLGTTLWESPYESREVNPMEVTGMNPMRKSLSKWSESMRNEWIEVNRVKWVNWRIWLCEPYGISLWSEEGVPMRVTWLISMRKSLSKWSDSMRFEWIEVKWVKWSEMSELKEVS